MILTTEEQVLVVAILRQRAAFCAELGRRAYGKKPYREGLRRKAKVLERLADAFATHTVITLTTPVSRAHAHGRAVCHACGCQDSTSSMQCSNCGRTGHLTYQPD